ncbi:hypothetical protein SCLCIDRAFT_33756 [Scleroderma citrinum Foug A]|uniref:Uncharacterized protein n=1 Tax=Scleroderma citrinum Foug A TaxID=1036808 RepID=A0A0C3D3U1_9AGAM|nr:hypothetical protein SCLCIDRAFT_33756 [Scleroderma citrinum Foug A]
MSRKSDRVRRPTEKAVVIPPSKGSHSRESKSKGSKSKGKRARSPSSGEDESQSESDPSEHAHTSKRSKGKQQRTKRAHQSSPDSAVVEIEEAVVLEIEEVKLSSRAGGDELSSHTGGDVDMEGETDDEDAAIPDKLQPQKHRALDILTIFSDRCIDAGVMSVCE